MSRPTNPWLDNPLPVSSVQPNLEVTLNKFHCHYIPQPGTYLYRLDSYARDAAIHFHEMRGVGHPPEDVGYPGDVYINAKPNAHELWAMQKVGEDGTRQWARWVAKEAERIRHPHLMYRYLWCSTRGEVSWYSPFVFEALTKHENPEGSGRLGSLSLRCLGLTPGARCLRKRMIEAETTLLETRGPKTVATLETGSVDALVSASIHGESSIRPAVLMEGPQRLYPDDGQVKGHGPHQRGSVAPCSGTHSAYGCFTISSQKARTRKQSAFTAGCAHSRTRCTSSPSSWWPRGTSRTGRVVASSTSGWVGAVSEIRRGVVPSLWVSG